MSSGSRRAVLIAAILLLGGCSYVYRFEVHGTVLDAATGDPIPSVRVEILQVKNGYNLLKDVSTDASGKFASNFHSSRRTGRGWILKLEASGYQTEEVEMGPIDVSAGKEPTYLIFHVMMRKVAPMDGETATKETSRSIPAPMAP